MLKINRDMLIVLGGLLVIAYFLLFQETHGKLIDIWTHSNTYGHGFIILPISTWLIWQKRNLISKIDFEFSYTGLALLLLSSAFWAVSRLSGINVLEQFFAIAVLISLAWSLFGWPIISKLKFPLFFLFFMVPVGDFMIPYLQFITADISVFMLHVLDIPVYRDGMYIQIPNGNFHVAEACSGIRFLISTFTIGLLFAYLNISHFAKRSIFIVLCLLIPILANGLRAFLMILIGHLSDMKAAVGFDHLVYGWFFFSIVMVILFVIGYQLSDVEKVKQENEETCLKTSVSPNFYMILIIPVFLSLGPTVSNLYDEKVQQKILSLEVKSDNVSEKRFSWRPFYKSADAMYYQEPDSESGIKLDVFVADYFFENNYKELISSQNFLFDKDKWSLDSISSKRITDETGVIIPYIEYKIVSLSGQSRVVRQTYQINGKFYANKLETKLNQLVSKFTLSDLGGRTIVVSSMNAADDVNQLDQFFMKHITSIDSDSMIRIQ